MGVIKIALGDLRHKVAGKHSFFMPLGVAGIASYTLSQLQPNTVDVRIYDDPDLMLKDLATWKPHVVGLAHYSWNNAISGLVFRFAKKHIPGVVCIGGGPDFPIDHGECRGYLQKRPEIDFFVCLEGEVAFKELVKKIQQGTQVHDLRSEPQDGVMSLHPKTGDVVVGQKLPRIKDLDVIPSPYVMGLLDPWFNGQFAPCIETARGCPFSCEFCVQGTADYTPVAAYSIPRLKEELTYIANRMAKYPNVLLCICDSNFGMYKRDEEIAEHVRALQDEYGWPNAFEVTTGKRNYERILKVSRTMHDKMPITCSLQSVYPKTLQAIKRTNLPMEDYVKINKVIKERGMRAATELIVPLPEETKDTFFQGLHKVVTQVNPDRVVPYTTILLNGTWLSSRECRTKYQMQTKYRVLPRQFGEYAGEKCFEIEEVCISTNTMPFEDYREIRGFALISAFFSNELFDVVHRHLNELKISKYDFIHRLWQLVKSGKTELSKTYDRHFQEVREELWDSPEVIVDHFRRQDNYNQLMKGSAGDNLIRAYVTELLLESSVPAIELAYSCIESMTDGSSSDKIRESLESAKRWMIATRNVSAFFKDRSYMNKSENQSLPYDVYAWYAHANGDPLVAYNQPVSYRTFYDADALKGIYADIEKLYGGNYSFQVGKLINNWDVRRFCRKCEPLQLANT